MLTIGNVQVRGLRYKQLDKGRRAVDILAAQKGSMTEEQAHLPFDRGVLRC